MQSLGPSRYKVETKSDWCHVCGRRRKIAFVDIWRPRNAEHEQNPGRHASYLRVCQTCLQALAHAVTHGEPGEPAA
ncbi:MAG: hypothetical protein ACKPEY_21215 [Planctomycetota bacterium]